MQELQHGEVALPGQSKPSAPGTLPVCMKYSVVTYWKTEVIVVVPEVKVSVVEPTARISKSVFAKTGREGTKKRAEWTSMSPMHQLYRSFHSIEKGRYWIVPRKYSLP